MREQKKKTIQDLIDEHVHGYGEAPPITAAEVRKLKQDLRNNKKFMENLETMDNVSKDFIRSMRKL